MVALEQVVSLEEEHRTAEKEMEMAMGRLAEEEEGRKATELKLAEVMQELKATVEILRNERIGVRLLKEETTTQAAQIESLKTAVVSEEAKRVRAEKDLLAAHLSLDEARDEGYNQGLDETEAFYTKEFAASKSFLFGQGWEAGLRAAGVPKKSNLYREIIFPPAAGTSQELPPAPGAAPDPTPEARPPSPDVEEMLAPPPVPAEEAQAPRSPTLQDT